jgi:ribonuclease HII
MSDDGGITMMRRETATGKTHPGKPRGPGLVHERKLWRDGHEIVAGMDEVGRGAWAGPVSVGVAVMRKGIRKIPNGLRDSKQLLEPVRESLFSPVGTWCAAWAVGHAWAEECDGLGMTKALRLAAKRAFASLPPEAYPNAIVLDGKFDFVSPREMKQVQDVEFVQGEMITDDPRISRFRWTRVDDPVYLELEEVRLPDGNCPQVKTVVKGDDICASVAAASVLAKVTRDRMMRADAESYPGFDFELNKGYPSPSHKCALRGYGLTAIHRRSWAFVDWLPLRSEWAPPSQADAGRAQMLLD